MNHFIPYTPDGPKPIEPKVFLTTEEHDALFPKLPYSLSETDLEILAHMFINSYVAMKKRQKIETENQDPE